MAIYTGENTREISFPLGGIGSGSIGLAGNGELIDWEIHNRPAKGTRNGFSHLAVRARTADGKIYARILQGDHIKDLVGQYGGGYGYGPTTRTMGDFRISVIGRSAGNFQLRKSRLPMRTSRRASS